MSKSTSLSTRILQGLALGVRRCESDPCHRPQVHPATPAFMQAVSTALFDPFGRNFLRMLLFVVIPLVFASLASGAVACMPDGSLPLIAGLLATFGVPLEGIGIVLGVDRVLNMLRTTVNVGSDIVTATVVDAQLRRKAARHLH